MAKGTPFKVKMRDAREDAHLSLEKATRLAVEALKEDVSISTVRRLENGETAEEKASVDLVAALAVVYGVKLRKLSGFLADKARERGDLLVSQSACNGYAAAA